MLPFFFRRIFSSLRYFGQTGVERRMAASIALISEKIRGENFLRRKHRADSGAYDASNGKIHRMLKDIVNQIAAIAATITSYGSRAKKDEKESALKCNHGVVIERMPNNNGKLKEAAEPKLIQLSKKHLPCHDIPNHLSVLDYVADIYKFYKDYERFDRPLDYIQHQVGITEDMRATVVDWIIAVHNKFALRPEALYLAIYIIDRYLSLERVHGGELKLVGISALNISSKYDELRAPQVHDFLCITGGAYSREEVLAMEKKILKSLHWKLTIPTQYMFLVQFLQTSMCDKEMEHMVFFLAELGLMQYSTVKFSPSLAAASSIYAARWTLRKRPHWTEALKHHTGLSEIQLMDCAQILVKSHLDAPRSNLKVVYDKYSMEQFGAVALHQPAREMLFEPSYLLIFWPYVTVDFNLRVSEEILDGDTSGPKCTILGYGGFQLKSIRRNFGWGSTRRHKLSGQLDASNLPPKIYGLRYASSEARRSMLVHPRLLV